MKRGGRDILGETRERTRASSGRAHTEGEGSPENVEEKASTRMFAMEAGIRINVIQDLRIEPQSLIITDIPERANRGRGRWIGRGLGGWGRESNRLRERRWSLSGEARLGDRVSKRDATRGGGLQKGFRRLTG
jgi:hypothetical protein